MGPSPAPRLEALGLRFGYGGGGSRTRFVDASALAIDDVSLELAPGTVLAIVGPNGSGKSTLLRLIARQLAPQGGLVRVDGIDLSQLGTNELARRLASVFTSGRTTELLTCKDVVEAGRYPFTGRLGVLTDEDRARVQESMELTSTWQLRERDFLQLSDGQRQRVIIARALAQEPRVLLLDEPTSFLDIRYQAELLSLVRDLARARGIAVVASLHDLGLAQRVADQVLCLRNGRVQALGSPEHALSGNQVDDLFDLGAQSCTYDELLGSAELARPTGDPQVFVIAGGATGTQPFRQLRREGIPFATGVLAQGSLDWVVARNLATTLISHGAFELVGPDDISHARDVLLTCKAVLACVDAYGTMNARCRELENVAIEHEIPLVRDADELIGLLHSNFRR